MSPRITALLHSDEVAVVLRAIDDLAHLSLGLLPEGLTPVEVLARSDEADRLADEIAARLPWADRDLVAEHHQTRGQLVEQITDRLTEQDPPP